MTSNLPIYKTFFAAPVSRGAAFRRAILWILNFLMLGLALLSAVTTRFDLWVDLRTLGPLRWLVYYAWAFSAAAAALCAGPRLAGFLARPRWEHRCRSRYWAARLLIPTYFLILCLLINTFWFFVLCYNGRADLALPVTLLAALFLAAWVWLIRGWMTAERDLPETVTARRTSHLAGAAIAIASLLLMAASFAIHLYARPPADKVDLAVVLGGHVLKNDVASVSLADRVLAAIDLYKRGQVKHILLSGAIYPRRDPNDPEANEITAMKQVCTQNGIPDDALSLDPVGVNTRATAYNSALFMQNNGYSSVVACSSDFHLFRTALAFREAGVRAYTVPSRPVEWVCADPRDTLREVVAIAVYSVNAHYRPPKATVMKIAAPRIVVKKSANSLKLYDGPVFLKSYVCITGGVPGDKEIEGDRKTPEGHFRIVFKNPESLYHLSLGLDYPNKEDADRGLKNGQITPAEHDQILAALESDLTKPDNQKKLWKTPLGGEIFLHGHANNRPGTAGCVALSNPDIEELYAVLPIGTPVDIEP